MKKIASFLLFLLPFFLFAENLYYYSNGKKIQLAETSGYTFIDTGVTKNAGLPKGLDFKLKHENIYLFEKLSSKNIVELKKSGRILPAYERNGSEKVYASGRIFVKLPKTDEKSAGKWCSSNGLRLIKKFKYATDWYLAETTENPIKKSVELVEKKIVEQAEPSFFMTFEYMTYIPNDTLFSKQWHLYNNGTDTTLTGSDSSYVAEAWDVLRQIKGELGGSNVKLAIVDDGFNLDHEDLQGRFLPGHDFVDGDDNPVPGSHGTELDKHGTSVAGVAAGATDNGKGIAGACPNCQIIPIRMGTTTADEIGIEAFEWAFDAGADIISNSWGPSNSSADMNQPLKDLVANITTNGRNGLGTIILFAAGNSNLSVPDNVYVGNPNVFTIGATNAAGVKASYSNFGTALDFVASSCDIESGGDGWQGNGTTIDGIWTTDNMGSSGYNLGGNENDGDSAGNYTNGFGGTSSACPLVAGITGLVMSANPNLTKDQIYDIFKETSDKVGGEQYDANGFNQNYGYGRVNACKAVRKALEMAGTDVSGVECGGAINQPDPVNPDPGDTDTADTDSPVDPTDTGDSQADPNCGNGVVDANEVCDGNTIPCSDLAGAPKNGEAKCASGCMSWDKSGCYDGDEPQAGDKDDAADGDNGGNGAILDDEDDSGCSALII